MYTIKRASQATGVSEATLRAWHKRYGLGTPHRSPAGYRLYDDATLARITAMVTLLNAGWAPAQAARQVLPDRSPPEEGAIPLGENPHVNSLLAAARAMDPEGIRGALTDAADGSTFETFVDHWLLGALQVVGTEWQRGLLDVSGEHLVSTVVRHHLVAEYERASQPFTAPRVVLGCPPHGQHDLVLFSFAVALRRRGLDTVYLGADVPAQSWAQALSTPGARCAVLTASTPADGAGLAAVQQAIADPSVLICVGGGYQNLAPAEFVQLGHRIGPAAEQLSQLVGVGLA